MAEVKGTNVKKKMETKSSEHYVIWLARVTLGKGKKSMWENNGTDAGQTKGTKSSEQRWEGRGKGSHFEIWGEIFTHAPKKLDFHPEY